MRERKYIFDTGVPFHSVTVKENVEGEWIVKTNFVSNANLTSEQSLLLGKALRDAQRAACDLNEQRSNGHRRSSGPEFLAE